MFRLLHIITVTVGLSLLTQVKSDDRTFARCYNTTNEMHCFSTTFAKLPNVSAAQNHCSQINATLLVIKSEEVQSLVESFINDSNPDSDLTFVWTNAYLNSTKTWHWLDTTVPLPNGFNLLTNMSRKDVACLEFQPTNSRTFDFVPLESLNASSYICECSDYGFGVGTASVLYHNGKYYVAFEAKFTWYEARNRCLKGSCDLASFRNLDSINFTNWLDTSPGSRYWIGLQQVEWNWNTSDSSDESSKVTFTNWWKNYPSILDLPCVVLQQGCEPPCAFKWHPVSCENRPTAFAVCQAVTPLKPETNTPICSSSSCASSSSTISVDVPTNPAAMMEHDDNFGVRVGVGVGVGVGVPLLIALVIIIIVVARNRKRKGRKTLNARTTESGENELGNQPRDQLGTENEDMTEGEVYWDKKNNDSSSPTAINEDNIDATSTTNVNALNEDNIDATWATNVNTFSEEDIDATPATNVNTFTEDNIDATSARNVNAINEDDIDATSARNVNAFNEDDIDAMWATNLNTFSEDDIDATPATDVNNDSNIVYYGEEVDRETD